MDIVDIKSVPIKVFTDAYRKSLEADDTNNMFDIAYQWQDKPHRHVWDLCTKLDEAADEIERLRQQNAELVDVLEQICSLRTIPLKNKELRVRLLSSIDIAKAAIAKATGGE